MEVGCRKEISGKEGNVWEAELERVEREKNGNPAGRVMVLK